MDTQKHTPGNWTRGTRTNTKEWMQIVSDGIIPIAEVKPLHKAGYREKDDFATEEANAKLICAAPDLLEALEDLVKKVSPIIYRLGTKKAFSELLSLEQAKKAIRKATE